jgi:hypothetical protein
MGSNSTIYFAVDRYLDSLQTRRRWVFGIKLRRIQGLMVILGDREDAGFPFRAIPSVLRPRADTIDRIRRRGVSMGSDL